MHAILWVSPIRSPLAHQTSSRLPNTQTLVALLGISDEPRSGYIWKTSDNLPEVGRHFLARHGLGMDALNSDPGRPRFQEQPLSVSLYTVLRTYGLIHAPAQARAASLVHHRADKNLITGGILAVCPFFLLFVSFSLSMSTGIRQSSVPVLPRLTLDTS